MKRRKLSDEFILWSVIACFAMMIILSVLLIKYSLLVSGLEQKVDSYAGELVLFEARYNDFGNQVVSVLQQHSYIMSVLVYRSQQLENATGLELVPFE